MPIELPKDAPLSPMLKRRGRFTVSCELLRTQNENLRRVLFPNVVITRAEALFDRDVIEYCALSPFFDEVDEGTESPEYEWTFRKQNDAVIIADVKRIP